MRVESSQRPETTSATHKADIHLSNTHDRLDHRRRSEVEVWRL
jgi:hypothetical protein